LDKIGWTAWQDYDLLSALKLKLKLVIAEVGFRRKVEDKVAAEYERIARYDRVSREYGSYINKYKDAQSPLEVKLTFARDKPGRKRAEVPLVKVSLSNTKAESGPDEQRVLPLITPPPAPQTPIPLCTPMAVSRACAARAKACRRR